MFLIFNNAVLNVDNIVSIKAHTKSYIEILDTLGRSRFACSENEQEIDDLLLDIIKSFKLGVNPTYHNLNIS